MKPTISTPYVVKLLQKIEELEFVIHNMRLRDNEKDAEIYNLRRKLKEDISDLKWKYNKEINTLRASIKFVIIARKILKIESCRYIDRIDFDDAEIVLPHVRFKDTYMGNRYRAIFYMWLKGYTYKDIAMPLKLSGQRIRQIIMKTAMIYRKQREGILKDLGIRAEISLITNDYRNNREEIINQIKEVYK